MNLSEIRNIIKITKNKYKIESNLIIEKNILIKKNEKLIIPKEKEINIKNNAFVM